MACRYDLAHSIGPRAGGNRGNRPHLPFLLWLVAGAALALALAPACSENGDAPGGREGCSRPSGRPACGPSLVAGPVEAGYDPELERLARLYDRQFHVFNAFGMGLNADVNLPLGEPEKREIVRAFLQESDGWDLEAFAAVSPLEVVGAWEKVAGLYAGAGIAADAYRYGVLRDQGYGEPEIATARRHLTDALDGLHVAVAITGVPGVIARGFIRIDIPGPGASTPLTPLFDGRGNPLPQPKDNGTWRADNSGGLYPDIIWEDSCSRDQLIGWAAAFGAAWEVVRDDPAIPRPAKERLQADAAALGRMLSTVRKSGYDLEIQDADGRPTFHAYLNEHAFDRFYLPWLPFRNGMHSIMSLGIIAALAYASEDPVLARYLDETLIGERGLAAIARANQVGVDFGVATNYSNVNMAFMGACLSLRYVRDEKAREDLSEALQSKLYAKPAPRQPAEIGQSLFDFVYAAGRAGGSAWRPMSAPPDSAALARGVRTLGEFPTPPFWDVEILNCDASEAKAGVCTAEDGTRLDLLGTVGRGDKLVSVQPVPMRTRPPSNYHWRTNPYEVNGGGDGSRLLPGVDFRYAYWLGRWVR